MRTKKPILLVEDDRVDQMTVRRALKDINVTNRLDIADNGEEALAVLRDPGHESPGIILLDLRMPKMDGVEFLRVVKGDAELRRIPVVVLTTSEAEEDIFRTYELGVNSFITKPVTFEGLVEVMKSLSRYWFEIVELPQDEVHIAVTQNASA